jgi:hypothetical protein
LLLLLLLVLVLVRLRFGVNQKLGIFGSVIVVVVVLFVGVEEVT